MSERVIANESTRDQKRAKLRESTKPLKRAMRNERTKKATRPRATDALFDLLSRYPTGYTFTSESLKKDAILAGVDMPEGSAWWGAFFNTMAKRVLARRTGRYIRAKAEITKSRMLAEWSKL